MRRRVVVNDRMQTGYVYHRTELVGRNFAPSFEPQLTPKQMLQLGVFGGKYMTDCREEFPSSWFARAKLCSERHDARLNYFGVNASQSLAEWRRQGWIHPQDPRGWFQWYCRYYMTGNGSFNGNTGGRNFGNSFLKLSPTGTLLDWFTPYNWSFLNSTDEDLGIQNPLLIPNTNLIVGGGKDGVMYVVNRTNMAASIASTAPSRATLL